MDPLPSFMKLIKLGWVRHFGSLIQHSFGLCTVLSLGDSARGNGSWSGPPTLLKDDPRDLSKMVKKIFKKGVFSNLLEFEGRGPKIFSKPRPQTFTARDLDTPLVSVLLRLDVS